ncbi:hypothetical protein [Microbispora sp. GKU 823]|uniref:hypothetical protein n=1 Tax=Microbispora sp. GKU 823 TaxID=1652100 RepID=UPI0026C0D480
MPVGGGSDGNFTAGVGCPTLDGLGAVGGGAHAAEEHVLVAEMPVRARLVAALVAYVLSGGPVSGPGGADPTRADPTHVDPTLRDVRQTAGETA